MRANTCSLIQKCSRLTTVCSRLTSITLALIASVAHADFELTVMHTNDFHARFEPINKFDSSCRSDDNQTGNCFGGTARLATAIEAVRATARHSILVDGGDQFQGTLFYTHYKGQVTAEMMNKLGYDAMTIGNHEFDDGPEVLRGFIDAVNFPILMSNADISREPLLTDKIKTSQIIERGGKRIGLIGLTPEDTHELSSPGKNIRFTDPVTAVNTDVTALINAGVNKIIVLSHSGYSIDIRLAEAVDGIDIIVGGHSNTLLSNTDEKATGAYPTFVNNTAIVQAYAYGKYLGILNVVFDDNGKIIETTGDSLIMDNQVIEDRNIIARLSALAKPLDEIRNQIVANTTGAINGERDTCRVRECQMGNLVADAMLDRVRDQGISVAIQNSGGLRASIDAGEVTMGEVLTVLPFLNTISTFELSGNDLMQALENGVSQVEDGSGRFPQVAGIRFHWNPAIDANQGRVSNIEIESNGDWLPLDPEKLYGVVSNNFMRNGGDGYAVFADKAINAYDFGPGLEQVLADYLIKQDHYQPYIDGRIAERQ